MNGLIQTTKRLLKLPKLPRIDLRGLTARRGALVCDFWHDSGRTDAVDTWVQGFSADEIAAMGGYHCVRAIYWFPNEDGPGNFNFDVYEDCPEEDILEPVMIQVGERSYTDLQPPKWLCERIRRILPPLPEAPDA